MSERLYRHHPSRLVSRRAFDSAVAKAAAIYGVKPADVVDPTRRRPQVFARQYAMWLLRQVKGPDGKPLHSQPEVGAAFGKDHTTVLHAERRVNERHAEATA